MDDKDKDKSDEPTGKVIEVQFGRGPSPRVLQEKHNARVLAGLGAENAKRAEDLRRQMLTVVSTTPMDQVPVLGVVEGKKVVRLMPPSQDGTRKGLEPAPVKVGEFTEQGFTEQGFTEQGSTEQVPIKAGGLSLKALLGALLGRIKSF